MTALLDSRAMEEIFELGRITCPSGDLVIVDGGYLGVWSGDGSPAGIDPERLGIDDPTVADDIVRAVDFEIVGPDAEAAARSFDRQPGTVLYDIPASGVTEVAGHFEKHCRERGLDARLEACTGRVAHRERARRCGAVGGGSFLAFGVPVVALGGLPRDRALPVLASRVDDGSGWAEMWVRVTDGPVAKSVPLGDICVDWARVAFGDADALGAWEHTRPMDGLADVAFWGREQDEVAREFGAPRLGTADEESAYGWTGLDITEAVEKAEALQSWMDAHPRLGLAFDLRPHSHHWQAMREVRSSALEAGTVEVGGAKVLFSMTSWGDGWFPVFADLDESGALVAVRLSFTDEDAE